MDVWNPAVVSATLVDVEGGVDQSSYEGPWKKSLRLRVEVEKAAPTPLMSGSVPTEELSDDADALGSRFPPILCISSHPTMRGLWPVVENLWPVNGRTLTCTVPAYEGSMRAATPFNVLAPTRKGENLCVVSSNEGAPRAFIAPPLYFHARMSVFNIDSIDTVAQSFRANSYLELRLRAVTTEQDEELMEALFAAYGFRLDMLDMMNVVERVREPEMWTSFASNMDGPERTDYAIKRRAHNVLAEEFELKRFPFDVQPLHILVTLNIPTSRAVIRNNDEYPSLFFHKSFQQKSVFDIVHQDQLHSALAFSDPSESSASYVYPRIVFTLTLRRQYGYYVTNVAAPIGVLTALTALTVGCIEPDGSRMGTADRLGLTFTLMLTAVAYKFVVASSLPQVSYQTYLDVYVLLCFLWMLLASLENALYPELGYDRSSGTAVERTSEYYLTAIYLSSFALCNIVFWTAVFTKVRARDAALLMTYNVEKTRRDEAFQRLPEQSVRLSK